MSFLSILLVASAFYFAHARPDSQSWDIPPEVKQVPAAPEDPSEPIMDPSNFQHQLFGLMEDMSKAVEQYMTPLMSKLEEKKQHQLKAMCMDGFASYINYVAAFVKRDTTAQSTNSLDALKKNMDDFKNCIDKSLANVVGEVNEDHLKPLFSVVGDQLNRFSKAFDALTKPKSSPDESEINI